MQLGLVRQEILSMCRKDIYQSVYKVGEKGL